jgi:glycosyltransferase involved in cell wall biosynthesis
MAESTRFNYIITIHNKEDLIEQVITCVLMCCRNNSHIYVVLDGCTDRTEKIIDGIIKKFSDIPITKVYTPDVHEILSINAGLRAANQEGDGYNIVLQDDVLLADFMLERKITQLYEWVGSSLGFMSFRLGANLTTDAATSNAIAPFTNFVENAYGHGLEKADVLLPGYFAYRTIPIKSPVCFPFSLVRSVGLLEERLAPYMYDDVEYALRCLKAGYRNAVFAIRFYSNVEWGSTRTNPDSKMGRNCKRNIEIIRELHGYKIAEICQNSQSIDIVELPNMVSEEDKLLALKTWEINRQKLQSFRSKRGLRTFNKIKSIVKGVLVN